MQKPFDCSGLRHQFSGIQTLEFNYSQADQDIFVLSLLDGKQNGTYLEIGCNHSFVENNTALLETKFDWHGVSLDVYKPWIDTWSRKNPAEHANGLEVDYLELLHRYNIYNTDLDYLSIDCDPATRTFEVLKKIPLDRVRFAVITFEHDCYATGPEVKNASRSYLQSHGYQLVVNNISRHGLAQDFEDWWIHPDLVDPVLVEMHTDLRDCVKDYTWYLYNRIPDCLKSTTWVKQFYQNTPN